MADDPSYIFCKPPNLSYLIIKIIEMMRFCDISNLNNSSNLNNVLLSKKSL